MTCPKCNDLRKVECLKCMGTGDTISGRCSVCNGIGTVPCDLCVPIVAREEAEREAEVSNGGGVLSQLRLGDLKQSYQQSSVKTKRIIFIGALIILSVFLSLSRRSPAPAPVEQPAVEDQEATFDPRELDS